MGEKEIIIMLLCSVTSLSWYFTKKDWKKVCDSVDDKWYIRAGRFIAFLCMYYITTMFGLLTLTAIYGYFRYLYLLSEVVS